MVFFCSHLWTLKNKNKNFYFECLFAASLLHVTLSIYSLFNSVQLCWEGWWWSSSCRHYKTAKRVRESETCKTAGFQESWTIRIEIRMETKRCMSSRRFHKFMLNVIFFWKLIKGEVFASNIVELLDFAVPARPLRSSLIIRKNI